MKGKTKLVQKARKLIDKFYFERKTQEDALQFAKAVQQFRQRGTSTEVKEIDDYLINKYLEKT